MGRKSKKKNIQKASKSREITVNALADLNVSEENSTNAEKKGDTFENGIIENINPNVINNNNISDGTNPTSLDGSNNLIGSNQGTSINPWNQPLISSSHSIVTAPCATQIGLQMLPTLHSNQDSVFNSSQIQQLNSTDPTPAEMSILGSTVTSNMEIGIYGKGHALHFGTSEDYHTHSNGKYRPSIDEINQRVLQIRRKMCKNGQNVKVSEVSSELCSYYNVSNVCQLNPIGRPIRKETDIKQILEIVLLQAKVCILFIM